VNGGANMAIDRTGILQRRPGRRSNRRQSQGFGWKIALVRHRNDVIARTSRK
jgi:hypothetical protein